MTQPYSIDAYGRMIADGVRISAYDRALSLAVAPGSIVVDLGTGAGIFALRACQLGARRVHAIEPGDCIDVAAASARSNGYADRIVFHRGLSTEVQLPERADVMVSDLRGVLPLYEGHLPSIVDARERLLRPDGALIPHRDVLRGAPVESPESYVPIDAFRSCSLGLDLEAARRFAANLWSKDRFRPEQLLAEDQPLIDLDYTRLDSPHGRGEAGFEVKRGGTCHGWCVWFDAHLHGEVSFSSSPFDRPTIYQQAFFPLQEPTTVEPGDLLVLDLEARLVGEDYVWRWTTRVRRARATGSESDLVFQQNTFAGSPVSPERLRRRVATFVPRMKEEGRATRRALELLDSSQEIQQVWRRLAEDFPKLFPTPDEARDFVGKLSDRFCA